MPPSAIFYDDSLEPCAQSGSVSWSGLPNPQLPLVFIGNSSEEQSVDEAWVFLRIIHLVLTFVSFISGLRGLTMARLTKLWKQSLLFYQKETRVRRLFELQILELWLLGEDRFGRFVRA
jgi:hypothetical protein